MNFKRKVTSFAVSLIFLVTSIVPTFAQGILGDVSGDGILTSVDSALILEQVLKGGILSGEVLELGKVSGEKELSVNDASLVLGRVLNLDNLFPVEKGEKQTTEGTTAEIDEETTEGATAGFGEETTEGTTTEVDEETTEGATAGFGEETTEGTTAEIDEETTEGTTFGEAYITLEDGNSVVSGAGVSIDGDDIVISQGGVYYVSGKLSDGRIVVNSEFDVEVVFDGVEISNSTGSPFYSISGDVDLKLQKGSKNVLTDAEIYSDVDADGEPDACLFTKDRLTIKGGGELTINANFGDGIASKDEIKIKNGKVSVISADDAIRGKDYIKITGGTLDLTAGGDGIKSTKGYITIDQSDKNVDIIVNAGKNGIKAETYLQIDNGEIDVTCNNNCIVASTGDLTVTGGVIGCSAKGTDTVNYNYDGIKASATNVYITGGKITTDVSQDSIQAGLLIQIEGGTLDLTSGDNGITSDGDVCLKGGEITLNTVGKGVKAETDLNIYDGVTVVAECTDDAIHSNGSIYIYGGDLTLSTGDDGVHADVAIVVSGGEINVTKSYEGIEAVDITIDGGTISIVSSDDGFNANGGSDNSGMGGNDKNEPWGRPGSSGGSSSSSGESSSGSSSSTTEETPCITINGGYIFVNALGDGIDSNGNIIFNGGTVIVDGPSSDGDGALDCGDNNNTIAYNGGVLLAVGSSGMAEAPSVSTSGKHAIKYNLSNSISSGNNITICNSDGDVLVSYKNKKTIKSIVFAEENIQGGDKILIYSGGTLLGEFDKNDVLLVGTVSGAEELATITISESSVTTSSGSSSSSGMPGGRF